ncbi:helix-turn-helix domain-containing protein [Yinghuangia sp. YIM S09857]|uniref:helix-turn-helix domain-containing protein n=1 Tax=Yinghuangia sp. YIM S09857 TaxID=3436929 RepID=UPI003F532D6B
MSSEIEPDEESRDWEREPDPSDSLRTFGAVVQALREHAALSRVEFGERVRFSKHTVASVELGRRMPDAAFVERAEEATGNTGALRNAAKHLRRGKPGLAAWFRRWAALERSAVSLCTYECRLVPGLLQTEAYTRAVFEGAPPLLTEAQLEAQLTARSERRKLLYDRQHVPFSFIVEEAVFWCAFDDTELRRELFDHVLALSERRNVTLQIVPLGSRLHACLDGPVQLLETPLGRRLAYSEGQQNGRLIADVKEVHLLQLRYDTLRSQALNPIETRGLLERLRGALGA